MTALPVDLRLCRFTLCFLTRGDDVLLLHRQRPPNRGWWNGVGGKLHAGELPLPACLREVREETGYVLPTARFAGILTWRGFEIEPGGLYIFTAPAPAGEPRAGPEGELRCHPRAWVFSHPQVVNNIHHFGPAALNGAAPIVYHFDYAEGAIAHVELFPLPVGGVVA